MAQTLKATDYKEPQCVCYRKTSHAKTAEDGQGWQETDTNDTLNAFDQGESRTPTIVAYAVESHAQDARYNVGEINQPLSANMEHDPANGGLAMVKENVKRTVYDWHRQDTRMTECGDVCVTAAAGWGGGGNNMPYVLEEKMVAEGINGETAGTLDANYYKGCGERQGTEREVVVMSDVAACRSAVDGEKGVHSQMLNNPEENFVLETPKCIGNGQSAQLGLHDVSHTLNCMHEQEALVENTRNVVRRLTPTECARLQGYPSDWMDIGEWTDTKGKAHKDADAPKYKAAGNSIALPFWEWLAKRICAEIGGEVTMASLFDGIGGFPLAFTRAGAKPIWASEIEEFPIAVTKKHFPE